MLLIIGATGKVGTALVAQLREQQLPFRALAHSPASLARLGEQGIDAVLVDEARPGWADAAFAGVDRAFLLTPGGPDQPATERALVDAARRAGVRRIVRLSVLAADDSTVSLLRSHRQAEQYVRKSGLGYTFLRPNAFMQNLGTADLPTIRQQGAIFNSAADGRVSFVDTRDIAAVAVAALRDERHVGQTYDLTGPEALSYSEVAVKLTSLLGRPVRHVPLEDEAYRGALLSAGLPGSLAEGLAELYRFYREGHGAVISDAVARLTGHPARTLDAYLTEHRALFAG